MEIKLKRLNDDAVLPDKAYDDAAGYDLYSVEEKVIESGGFSGIKTGWSIQLPPRTEAQIRPKSGLAIRHGVTVLNAPGTIDPDYRGEIIVILINHGADAFVVEKGSKIAQMVISELCDTRLSTVDELDETSRDARGFGSSGR